ncbi:MAG: sigma-70 family RNA polymerase sigma factor [Crinalium sp.]
MVQLQERLQQLITETCQHPPQSVKRQRGLTQIIRLIINSGKIWEDYTADYADAWQQTWEYFCRNLCEATTAKHEYDSTRSSVTTWLNNYLRWRLQDIRIETNKENIHIVSNITSIDNELQDIFDTIAATPDLPPILQATQEWVKTDPTGELSKTHIRGHKDVTCQVLILRRLPPETGWKELSTEFNIKPSTLSTFYERKCRLLLRKFAEEEGYISRD